jgi:type IV secretory pathway TrbF-like protein
LTTTNRSIALTSAVPHEKPIPIAQTVDKDSAEPPPARVAYNPYLAARREWDERYGSLVTRERNWRFVAILCSVVSLASVGGMMRLSGKSHIVPFVVAMDSLGRTAAAGLAEQSSPTDDRLKRATLFNWVEDLRTVTSDGIAQRKAIDRVYAHIASGGQAQAFVSEFYRADPPQKRAAVETVSVEVRSVLPTSDRTFEVEWMEITRDLYGAVKAQDHWKASFSIAVNPPTDERMARINPLGIYVTNASWGKVF